MTGKIKEAIMHTITIFMLPVMTGIITVVIMFTITIIMMTMVMTKHGLSHLYTSATCHRSIM